MNRSYLLALMLFGLSIPAVAQSGVSPDQQWQQHMTEMQQLHQQWLQSKTPEQRQQLMQQHRQNLAESMPMLGGCPGMQSASGMPGQAMMGKGMGHGRAQWLDAPEQLEQHIQHMEQMLEQLRARRDMLDKP